MPFGRKQKFLKTRVVVVKKISSALTEPDGNPIFISLNVMVNQNKRNSQSVERNVFCKFTKIVKRKEKELMRQLKSEPRVME